MVRKFKNKPKLNKWETLVKQRLASAGLFPESQVSPFENSKHRFDFRLKRQRVFVEVDGIHHRKDVRSAWTDAYKTFQAAKLGYKVLRIRAPDQDNVNTRDEFDKRALKLATDLTNQNNGYYY